MAWEKVFVMTCKSSGVERVFPSFREAQNDVNRQEGIDVRVGCFEPDSYTITERWQEVT